MNYSNYLLFVTLIIITNQYIKASFPSVKTKMLKEELNISSCHYGSYHNYSVNKCLTDNHQNCKNYNQIYGICSSCYESYNNINTKDQPINCQKDSKDYDKWSWLKKSLLFPLNWCYSKLYNLKVCLLKKKRYLYIIIIIVISAVVYMIIWLLA